MASLADRKVELGDRGGSRLNRLGRRALLQGLSLAALPVWRSGAAVDRPVWREPSFSDLRGWITPVEQYFIRRHLALPRIEARNWKLAIDGLVERQLEITYEELLHFAHVRRVVTSECAGNLAGGGMVGNAEWSGVSLAALLKHAGIQSGAVEVILDGVDCGLDEGENVPVCYSRSIPVQKALAPETLLAAEMNGRLLTLEHGYPVRAVVPGWYAMSNVKWLRRIHVTDRPFGGFYMSKRYFTAKRDAVTGEFGITRLTEMSVKSQIARPRQGEVLKREPYLIRGAAWTGSGQVERVDVSGDGGETWRRASLGKERAQYAWRVWEHIWKPPGPGKHTILVRAFDERGNTQPAAEDMERINRYANCWIHRVAVEVSD